MIFSNGGHFGRISEDSGVSHTHNESCLLPRRMVFSLFFIGGILPDCEAALFNP